MVKIFRRGKRIEYTRGDTFLIRIYPKEGKTFPQDSTLELVIAEESSKSEIIKNTYNLNDGVFIVDFTKKDTEIPYGEYVYKMVLRTPEGIIITQKDGDFVVIWGA